MSATSSQPAIKFVTSRHLGTKWSGWFSTRPKAHFEPLISSGHFDPLVSVVQFSPLILQAFQILLNIDVVNITHILSRTEINHVLTYNVTEPMCYTFIKEVQVLL